MRIDVGNKLEQDERFGDLDGLRGRVFRGRGRASVCDRGDLRSGSLAAVASVMGFE